MGISGGALTVATAVLIIVVALLPISTKLLPIEKGKQLRQPQLCGGFRKGKTTRWACTAHMTACFVWRSDLSSIEKHAEWSCWGLVEGVWDRCNIASWAYVLHILADLPCIRRVEKHVQVEKYGRSREKRGKTPSEPISSRKAIVTYSAQLRRPPFVNSLGQVFVCEFCIFPSSCRARVLNHLP